MPVVMDTAKASIASETPKSAISITLMSFLPFVYEIPARPFPERTFIP